jgi:hypothetical protein
MAYPLAPQVLQVGTTTHLAALQKAMVTIRIQSRCKTELQQGAMIHREDRILLQEQRH